MVIRHRQIWLSLHRWVGLILGAVVAVLGVTGAALVFEDDIDAALNPALLTVTPAGALKSFDAIAMAAVAAHPGTKAGYLERRSDAPTAAFKVVLRDPAGPDRHVYVDPYSLRVLGERSGLSGLALMREIHGHLLMGDFGRTIVGVLSILCVIFFVAGVVLWWPPRGGFRRALTVTPNAPAPRLMREVHNVAGAPLAILLVVAALTVPPIVWKFAPPAGGPQAGAGAAPATRPASPPSPTEPHGPPISWQHAAEIAAEHAPGQYAGLILLNEGARPLFMVRFWPAGHPATVSEMTNVFIEPYAGRFLRMQSPATPTAMSVLQADFAANIHSGFVAGLPGRIAMAVAGLACPVLFATGLALWLLKRRRPTQN